MKHTYSLTFFLAFALFAVRAAEAQKVSLGPGVMTFPEIARQLSVHGRTVTCSEELAQRAAFVYLKARSWDQIALLLSKGLQIRIVPLKEGGQAFQIRRDPVVISRERKWLSAFAENVHEFMQARSRFLAPYDAMDDRDAAKSSELFRQQDALNSEEIHSLDPATAANRDRLDELLQRHIALSIKAAFLESPTRHLLYGWFANNLILANQIEDCIKAGQVLRITPLDGEGRQALETLRETILSDQPRTVLENYDQLLVGMQFMCCSEGVGFIPHVTFEDANQSTIRLDPFIATVRLTRRGPAVDGVFKGVARPAEVTLNALGAEANAWLDNQRALTDQFLKGEQARKTVAAKPGSPRLTELSQYVETWSRALDAEAIMELRPQQERVNPRISGYAFQLTDLYDASTSPWSFIDNNHVLMVTDRLAFLDRWPNVPAASLIRYQRRVGDKPQGYNDPLDYGDLRSYCKEVSGSDVCFWTYPGIVREYRGVATNRLDRTIGAMMLWDMIPQLERDRMLDDARKMFGKHPLWAHDVSLPMTHFSERDRTRLIMKLRNWGFDYQNSFHPGFPDEIARASYNIRFSREADAPGEYHIQIGVTPARGRYLSNFGIEADFRWKPN